MKTENPHNVQCAKCGSCVPVCPIFQATGRETLTARGRIHLLAKLTNPKTAEFGDILSKCLLCGACRNACPRGIDIPATIIAARSNIKQFDKDSFKKKFIRQLLGSPILLKTITSITELAPNKAQLPAESGLNLRLAGLDLSITMPNKSFIDTQKNKSPTTLPKNSVLYFTGCLANHLSPGIASSSTTLLKKLCGLETFTPTQQGCCGMASLSAGDYEKAIKVAKDNIDAFSTGEIANLPIFTSCSTCYSALRQYPELFKHDEFWKKKADQFAQRLCEFSSFLLKNRQTDTLPTDHKPPGSSQQFFYHDPCHLRYGHPDGAAPYPPITQQPRELLQTTTGITPLELPNGPQCCGQGGLFHISHPELAAQVNDSLVNNVRQLNAKYIVTTCSGCLLQWKSAMTKTQPTSQCLHLAEFIECFPA
nr:(Fe-S)-binding protein [Desulfobulbaceae bacterium]